MGGLLNLITGPITGLVKEVGGVIDSLSTTKEEKLAAQAKLLELQNVFTIQMAQLDTQFAAEQAKVIIAEAQSESWITRNWRPLLMLTFTFIVAWNYIAVPVLSAFGLDLVAATIPADMWDMLKIGTGGYLFGRSAEKTVPQIITAVKEFNKK